METRTSLAIIAIVVAVGLAGAVSSSLVTPVSADKGSGSNGLERADDNVHENTPGDGGGFQDQKFHNGICQGGHSTAAFQCP